MGCVGYLTGRAAKIGHALLRQSEGKTSRSAISLGTEATERLTAPR